MAWLLLAGTLAQGADAMSMRLSHEANGLVVDLGPLAYLAKIALILLVPSLVLAIRLLPRGTHRLQRSVSLLLSFAFLTVGLWGAISNLLSG